MASIGIVIRTKNEAAWLGQTLAALAEQSRRDYEIVVIDSGSTDATRALALAGGARLLAIRAADFTYGRALNLAIDRLTTPLIVSLSAHATPAGPDWLANLTGWFREPTVGAVTGRQIPRANATRLERLGMRLSGTLDRRPRRLPRGIGYSNANGAFRRAGWEAIPFDETLAGAEDYAWARLMQRAGWTIGYEPAAAVHHSHGEPWGALVRRLLHDQPVIVRAWLGRLPPDPAATRRRVPVAVIRTETTVGPARRDGRPSSLGPAEAARSELIRPAH